MLDIKMIRKDPKAAEEMLRRRGDYSLSGILEADEKRRALIGEAEELKARQNSVSKKIPQMKKDGTDTQSLLSEMKQISQKVKEYDSLIAEYDEQILALLLSTPNMPNEGVHIGADETENTELRKVGEPRVFDFEAKPHWDICTSLGIVDFERAVKIAGARFSMWVGEGAQLERAIINFMLSLHTNEHGYTEIIPPLIVNRKTMTGTGQLPKFEDDAFSLKNDDFFLIPTAEVPLTNFYRDEILAYDQLPVSLTAFTPCFRAEAGSAGRDTRGLIRNHQFDKVELVNISKPENSYEILEKMTAEAEEVLRRLGLPYRVIELCTGDLGFSAAKTYDIEVWMPSYNRYVEISSCSNCEDYQARRAGLRYRNQDGQLSYVHTLNGSALAVGRTFAAIAENYQNSDGSVSVPEVLQKYMGDKKVIKGV